MEMTRVLPEMLTQEFAPPCADNRPVPDRRIHQDVFVSADGTRVVGRYRYEGTHAGNFLGYPATGNAFAMRSIDIWRVEDGRFVELNTLDIFSQVGAVPSLGQPS